MWLQEDELFSLTPLMRFEAKLKSWLIWSFEPWKNYCLVSSTVEHCLICLVHYIREVYLVVFCFFVLLFGCFKSWLIWIWASFEGMDSPAELWLRGLHQRPVCWWPKQRHSAAGWDPAGGGRQTLLLPGAAQAVPVQPLPAQRHLPGGLEPLRVWLFWHRLPGTLLWERWAPTAPDKTRLDVWQDVRRVSGVKRWQEPLGLNKEVDAYAKKIDNLACRDH